MKTSDKVFGIICGVAVLCGIPFLIAGTTANSSALSIVGTICMTVFVVGLIAWLFVGKKWKEEQKNIFETASKQLTKPENKYILYRQKIKEDIPSLIICLLFTPLAQLGAQFVYTEQVAGSNPAGSTIIGVVAHLEERLLCKQDVAGSTPVNSTIYLLDWRNRQTCMAQNHVPQGVRVRVSYRAPRFLR